MKLTGFQNYKALWKILPECACGKINVGNIQTIPSEADLSQNIITYLAILSNRQEE